MRDAVHISSLAELLPAAESVWVRELALVDAAPSPLTGADTCDTAEEQSQPAPAAAVPPPS